MVMDSTHCCGAHIYNGISRNTRFGVGEDAAGHLCNIAVDWCRGPGTHIVKAVVTMYDVSMRMGRPGRDTGHAAAFRDYVHHNGLGEVTLSSWIKNPNSGNWIRGVTWVLDMSAWVKWRDRHKDAEPARREWERQQRADADWEPRGDTIWCHAEILPLPEAGGGVLDALRQYVGLYGGADQGFQAAEQRAAVHMQQLDRDTRRALELQQAEHQRNAARNDRIRIPRAGEGDYRGPGEWDAEARANWMRDPRNRGLRPPWQPERPAARRAREELARINRVAALRRRT